jgi:L-ectoine synthase
MIVRSLEDIRKSGHEIKSDGWTSRRYLLNKDKMGFSFHETIIDEGAELNMWYKNHLESVYCVAGEGQIIARDTGEKWDIKPGTIYALDKHDKHTLICHKELRLLCAFNPPCTGQEKHDAEGAYPLLKDES